MKLRDIHILLLTSLFIISCRMNPYDNIGSPEEITISVARYDRLLDEYVKYNSFSALQKLNTDHIQITRILIEDVLSIGDVNENDFTEKLKTFYSDPTLLQLTEDAEAKFSNLTALEGKLTKGFRNLHEEAPSIIIPKVYTQISALNQSIVVGDSLLGISLDKYMGGDYPLYQRYYFDYQRKFMHPDRIAPDCFVFYLLSEYPFPLYSQNSLLNIMLHHGKIHYVTQQLLEYDSLEEVMGYSDQEKKWCKENQKKLWRHIIDNKHVYATDPQSLGRYAGVEPATFFDEEAPSQIGIWLGSKIIASYMKYNKKVTLLDLLRMTDYQRILENSRFNS